MNIVGDIAKSLIEPVTGLISEFITDKDKAAELAHKVSTMAAVQAHENRLAQIDVNKREADSKSLFKGGWRPAVGWTCGLALFNNYLIVPYAIALGVAVPSLDLGELMPVLMGMLGLGYLRTDEKKAGIVP